MCALISQNISSLSSELFTKKNRFKSNFQLSQNPIYEQPYEIFRLGPIYKPPPLTINPWSQSDENQKNLVSETIHGGVYFKRGDTSKKGLLWMEGFKESQTTDVGNGGDIPLWRARAHPPQRDGVDGGACATVVDGHVRRGAGGTAGSGEFSWKNTDKKLNTTSGRNRWCFSCCIYRKTTVGNVWPTSYPTVSSERLSLDNLSQRDKNRNGQVRVRIRVRVLDNSHFRSPPLFSFSVFSNGMGKKNIFNAF